MGDFFVLAREEREGGTQGEGKRGYGRGFSEVMLEVRPAETCRFGQSLVIKKKKKKRVRVLTGTFSG